jgi:hypothetical protein
MSRFSGLELSEHPRATALVICDRIITEEGTKKRSLVDIFDSVIVAQLPAVLVRLGIYVAVSRGTRDVSEMYLGLFAPNGEAMLRSVLGVTDWGTGHAEFDLTLQGVPFTAEGVYDLRLFVADHVLAQRPLVVKIVPPPPAEQADSPTP